MNDHRLAKVFQHFGEYECNVSSPLYEYLSLQIAEDKKLLELSSHVHDVQPVPNLLFGSVHYLLLKGKEHPLRKFYPSITENYGRPEEVFAAFKDFAISIILKLSQF